MPLTRDQLIHDHLASRCRSDPSAPLLTHYDPSGRTELSGRSFANWVDKTANLMLDELDRVAGDRVRLVVAEEHPGHWMTLVWAMACLQAGLVVVDHDADLDVVGPLTAGSAAATGTATVSCSLHPLALPQRDLPVGVLDFTAEALAQPDAYLGTHPSAQDAALELGELALDQQGVVDLAPGTRERLLLVAPADLVQALREALLAPLLGGGSGVVVEGITDAARLARIAEEEKAEPQGSEPQREGSPWMR